MARVSCRRQLLAPLVEHFAGTRSGNFSYEVHQTREPFRSKKGFVAVESGLCSTASRIATNFHTY